MTLAQLHALSKTALEVQREAEKMQGQGGSSLPQEGTVEDWAMLASLPLAG